MSITELFDIKKSKREMISLIGGGGKTTTIFKLAHSLRAIDKRVLITTTTAMYNPTTELYHNLVLLDRNQRTDKDRDRDKGTITILGKCISKENKLLGVDAHYLDELFSQEIFDYILVEADGAKKKPIKAPADHEPVIPNMTSITIGVIGMDSLEKTIDENNVHRSEIFTKITNSRIGDLITEEVISRLVVSKEGLFKDTPVYSKRYLLLNKADEMKQMEQAMIISNMIRKSKFSLEKILVGSMVRERLKKV